MTHYQKVGLWQLTHADSHHKTRDPQSVEGFGTPLSLSPNDLVAAVTLENEGALLYAFFIVFAAVMARVFARDLL